MRLGVDIDGVLARFNNAFARVLVEVNGKDLLPHPFPEFSPCWEWPTFYGYSPEEEQRAWEVVWADPSFWRRLPGLDGASDAIYRLNLLAFNGADIYFVTNRRGTEVKQQSERWLEARGMYNPTVLIASDKVSIVNALQIDAFVDDYLKNVNALRAGTKARIYVKEEPKNMEGRLSGIIPVQSCSEFIDRETGKLLCRQ